MKSIILKQIIEVDHYSDKDSKALTDHLSQLCRGKMMTILEKAINKFDQPETMVSVDKLVIELNCKDIDDLEEMIVTKFSRKLEYALKSEAINRNNAKKIPVEDSFYKAILFYLKNGYLSWNVTQTMTLAEMEFRLTEALDKNPGLVSKFVIELLNDRVKLKRFTSCFSETILWRVADLLKSDIKTILDDEVGFRKLPSQTGFDFWKTMYAHLNIKQTDDPYLVRELTQALENIKSSNVKESEPILKNELETIEHRKEFPEEGIFIHNAGVVILHPFLMAIFSELKITEGHKIINIDKAVQILNYAVKGVETMEEWEVPLYKILCGIPLEDVAILDHKLKATEKAEIDKMLTSLIKHWEILKNTSIAGLQETFLQREGRITEGKTNWILRVQPKSTDILLDHLRWSIGIIKLPWMEKQLVTEWN